MVKEKVVGCCSTKSNIKTDSMNGSICPLCKKKGLKVKNITLQSLLLDSLTKKLERKGEYFWCNSNSCEVSYFSAQSVNYFRVSDLKVVATVKDLSLEVTTCYCFNHTRKSILNEIMETGKSTVIDDIKAKMKDPGCFCEKSNPQGSCCLSVNISWLSEIKRTYNI